MDIDPATDDRSCHADSDCIVISAGGYCGGFGCACGNAAINTDGQARYSEAFGSVKPGRNARGEALFAAGGQRQRISPAA